jgi:transcriptional regulator with XRE-family HTH domain
VSVQDERRFDATTAFGALLRRHRTEAGLSQEALAESAGMTARGLGALERGDRLTPQRATLSLPADALVLDSERRRAFEAAARGHHRPPIARRVGDAHAPSLEEHSALPLSLTRFVGRRREVAEVTALVRDHRLVTLTGIGGIGKTRAALEVAAVCGDVRRVAFVELAPLAEPMQVLGGSPRPAAFATSPRERSSRRLSGGGRSAPARQQTMYGAVAWS